MKKYLLLIFVLLLASCAGQQKPTELKMPDINIALDQMNKIITIEPALGMMDTFKFAGILQLNLNNLSDRPVIFSSDFGVKIFMKQDTNWISIKNTFGYSDSSNEVPPQKNYALGTVVDVAPLFPSTSASKTIRIVVLGHVQGTNQLVGAYIDIEVN
jgi:hypothetical protein